MTSKGLSYVGEFLIEEATIITSENLVLDIASDIVNIDIISFSYFIVGLPVYNEFDLFDTIKRII